MQNAIKGDGEGSRGRARERGGRVSEQASERHDSAVTDAEGKGKRPFQWEAAAVAAGGGDEN